MACEHIIGEWLYYADTYLVTIEDLKNEIAFSNKYRWANERERTLKDYADKRKDVNFIRFDFCPKCGEKIDWEKMSEVE